MPPLRRASNDLFFPCCLLTWTNEKTQQKKQHEFCEQTTLIHRKQKEKQQWLQVEQQCTRTTCIPVHCLRATNQCPFCSLWTKRNNKTNNNNFVSINMTKITSSCKTQVSWCLLVTQIKKNHKAQLNKEALVLLLQLSLSCVFFFFGGICFSSQAALNSSASFFENQLPQETHYQEVY